MISQVNLLELLSGSEGKLLYFINNENLSFKWVLHGNFTFINLMIPMSFKWQNQDELLSGIKLSNLLKNLIFLFYVRNHLK